MKVMVITKFYLYALICGTISFVLLAKFHLITGMIFVMLALIYSVLDVIHPPDDFDGPQMPA